MCSKGSKDTLGTLAPCGSGGDGNTKSPPSKRVNASKRWCFTLNNYTEEEVGSIKASIQEYCTFGTFGYEICPTTKTPHLQGYLELKLKDRPINKKYGWGNRISWRKAKGDKQSNIHYTEKDQDKIFIFPKQYTVEIKNWFKWELDLIQALKKAPDDRTIHWVWEKEGCAGKTVFQKWIYLNLKKRTITLSGKCDDMKNGIVQYEKTNGLLPEIILINIPRVNKNFVSIAGIEQIKDMYFFCGKYEGGMVCGPNPHVIIFANERPPEGVLSEDRLKELYIGLTDVDESWLS